MIAIDGGAHCFGVSGENVSVDAVVPACVRRISVARRAVDEQRDRVCARDLERCVCISVSGQYLSTLRHGQQRGMKTHTCLMFLHWQPGVVVHRKRLPLHDDLVFVCALRLKAAGAVK